MRLALVGALAHQPQHRALGLHRLDRARPELDRLLHHPVHLVAGGQRLHQNDLQGRFAVHLAPGIYLRPGGLAAHLQRGLGLAALAVEQHDTLAVTQAQHAHGVVGERVGEFELARSGQAARKVKA